jgi:hypothetical protein
VEVIAIGLLPAFKVKPVVSIAPPEIAAVVAEGVVTVPPPKLTVPVPAISPLERPSDVVTVKVPLTVAAALATVKESTVRFPLTVAGPFTVRESAVWVPAVSVAGEFTVTAAADISTVAVIMVRSRGAFSSRLEATVSVPVPVIVPPFTAAVVTVRFCPFMSRVPAVTVKESTAKSPVIIGSLGPRLAISSVSPAGKMAGRTGGAEGVQLREFVQAVSVPITTGSLVHI